MQHKLYTSERWHEGAKNIAPLFDMVDPCGSDRVLAKVKLCLDF